MFAAVVINVAIAVLPVVGWLMLALGAGTDLSLAARGLGSLKYFTVLSNLFASLTAVIALAILMGGQVGMGGTDELPTLLLLLKLSSATSVMLTFLVVVTLLGPSLGYRRMFESGNFFLHLVVPLLAAFDCVTFVPVGRLPFVATLCGVVPCALYSLWYLSNVLTHGSKKDGVVYDFYGFLRWGREKIPVVAAAVLCATWAISIALWFGSGLVCCG